MTRAITDVFVLPPDVLLVPASELPAEVREQAQCGDDEFGLTRPKSREPAKIVGAELGRLLLRFRTPTTIVQAVIDHSREQGLEPARTLDEAFPVLRRLIRGGLLISNTAGGRKVLEPSLAPGEELAGFRVLKCVHLLEDTELYEAEAPEGRKVAVKLARVESASTEAQRMLEREAGVLAHLGGRVGPPLLATGLEGERRYLAMAWADGVHVSAVARDLRHAAGGSSRQRQLELCCAILRAYSALHAQGVCHGDIHPGNVLVTATGAVTLIDFGLARLVSGSAERNTPPRGGIGFYFEPEYARARLAGEKTPPASFAGEQYSVAVMLYLLLTGEHYLEFSLEKLEALRQISQELPLPFTRRGRSAWPEVEQVLARALAKEPAARFSSMTEFAASLEAALASCDAAPEPGAGDTDVDKEFVETCLARFAMGGPLISSGVRSAPSCSVNYGSAGVAHALHRIAAVRDDAALLATADVWASKASAEVGEAHAFYSERLGVTPETVGRLSPYHTASGVHCVDALLAYARGDLVSHRAALDAFVHASTQPCEQLDLTLGHAGTLLACGLLLEVAPDAKGVRELGEATLAHLWARLDTFEPIPECGAFPFLGIAHGWAGVLYATLRWCEAAGQPWPTRLRMRLDELAACAKPWGRGLRWRRRLASPGRAATEDYLAGWCNGSSGYIHLWTLAYTMTREHSFLLLAERAAWATWDADEQVGNLCCGSAGQAYGLLNLYRHVGDPGWLDRARELARRAVATIPASEWGLYKGQAGVAVLLAELRCPEKARMPFFESDGWSS